MKINDTTFLLIEPFAKILSLVNDRPTIPLKALFLCLMEARMSFSRHNSPNPSVDESHSKGLFFVVLPIISYFCNDNKLL